MAGSRQTVARLVGKSKYGWTVLTNGGLTKMQISFASHRTNNFPLRASLARYFARATKLGLSSAFFRRPERLQTGNLPRCRKPCAAGARVFCGSNSRMTKCPEGPALREFTGSKSSQTRRRAGTWAAPQQKTSAGCGKPSATTTTRPLSLTLYGRGELHLRRIREESILQLMEFIRLHPFSVEKRKFPQAPFASVSSLRGATVSSGCP